MKPKSVPPTRPDISEHLVLPLYRCLTNTGTGATLNIKRRQAKVDDATIKELSTFGLTRYVESGKQWIIASPYSLVARIYRRGEMSKLDVARWCGLSELPEGEELGRDTDDAITPPTPEPVSSPTDRQILYDVRTKTSGETTPDAPIHLVTLVLNAYNDWVYTAYDGAFIIENEHCTITVKPV